MKKMSKAPHKPTGVSFAALDETLRLYNGWLAYLLCRLGESEIRVEADELKEALRTFSCRVERKGSAYVICLDAPTGREGHDNE